MMNKHTKISCEEIYDDRFFTAIFIVVERSRLYAPWILNPYYKLVSFTLAF